MEQNTKKIDRLVPDTSIIIEGIVSEKLENKEFAPSEIIIHEAVLAELEHQANTNRTIGFLGLEEIKKLKEMSSTSNFELKFSGIRPRPIEIKNASIGEIDSMIRELAYQEDATLITADNVQARVAEAKGIPIIYIRKSFKPSQIKLESYFTDNTMSVHLKESTIPVAKCGIPGKWDFVQLSKNNLSQDEVISIAREIIEEANLRKDGFVELDRSGSTIIQLGKFRIVICRPPFADGWEITAVRPVALLHLEDYNLTEKLKDRLEKQAEGILIAGSPGMGKSTFAQALAEFYANKNKIVKTVEAPRDLVLGKEITQYSISHGSPEEIHDILLLSRPDYTVYDEMRNNEDFSLFADMRLAGVGMIGVLHATKAIDAIQRLIGRVEMGVIPQIVDTVIFIKNGKIHTVLDLNITVKVPSGMTEADLSRPIVVVNDFETNKPLYEIYSYGDQTVVVPVKEQDRSSPIQKLAMESIDRFFQRVCENAKVELISNDKCVVYVPEHEIARIIGKQGKNIEGLEKQLGLSIQVKELTESTGDSLDYEYKITSKGITFLLRKSMINQDIDIYVGEDYLLSAKVSKNATININRKNKLSKLIVDELDNDGNVTLHSLNKF